MNILFVCSRNQWRSPTGEEIYKNRSDLNVRSAGTASSARIKITEKIVVWTDLIFVMGKKHKQIIQERFSYVSEAKQIVLLDIPDEYQYMDSELIEEIKTKENQYISL